MIKEPRILVSSLFKHYTRRLYWVHLIITFAIIPSPHQAVERPQVLQLTTTPPFAKLSPLPSASMLNSQSSMLNSSLYLLSGLAGHLSPLEPLIMYILPLLKSEQIDQLTKPSFTLRNLSATLLLKTWERGGHTAPEWCQPDKLTTLSFSAFLVVCDQDRKPHVGQQILKGGNFCQLTSLLLHHKLSVTSTDSSENNCCPT